MQLVVRADNITGAKSGCAATVTESSGPRGTALLSSLAATYGKISNAEVLQCVLTKIALDVF
jgi:hypothetical protein